jgi:HD-GYP domain-containing protein (c-di-GMP phosphodiesterase class II)
MLKKISINDARIGMFVREICGSWLDSPFWKKSFTLATPKELQALIDHGIQEVWIDTEYGLDVRPDAEVTTEEEANKKIDSLLQAASAAARQARHRVAFHEEIDRARALQSRAKTVVASMLREARAGGMPEIAAATELVEDIAQSVSRNSSAFLYLARIKKREELLAQHPVAVCALMVALGAQLELPDDVLRSLGLAGLLHDIGYTLIPGNLPDKHGSLTDAEYGAMKTHPQLGWNLLKESPQIHEMVLDICLHHHERMDGAGYPKKLAGTALSQPVQIAAVCEVFDTVVSGNYAKEGWSSAKAIRKMAEWQNGHFDQTVFNAFVKTVGIYPAGTLVKLKSGRMATVVEQTEKSLLTPVVKVFFSTNINAPVFPELIDLSRAQDSIESIENPAKWKININAVMGA